MVAFLRQSLVAAVAVVFGSHAFSAVWQLCPFGPPSRSGVGPRRGRGRGWSGRYRGSEAITRVGT